MNQMLFEESDVFAKEEGKICCIPDLQLKISMVNDHPIKKWLGYGITMKASNLVKGDVFKKNCIWIHREKKDFFCYIFSLPATSYAAHTFYRTIQYRLAQYFQTVYNCDFLKRRWQCWLETEPSAIKIVCLFSLSHVMAFLCWSAVMNVQIEEQPVTVEINFHSSTVISE